MPRAELSGVRWCIFAPRGYTKQRPLQRANPWASLSHGEAAVTDAIAFAAERVAGAARLTTPYSMISSARTSSEGGTSRPSAFAVFKVQARFVFG